MERPTKLLICGFLIVLASLAPMHAQHATTDSNAAPSTPAAAQAPEDMTKKITDLVNAGKYAEAQQLTTGLLVAYPDDQRLIKAKALIEKLLPPDSAANGTSQNSQPAQPAANNGEEFSGMDKIDYNALIELAREA